MIYLCTRFLQNLLFTQGGLTWWRGLIIVACFNLVSTQDELRIYPNNTNLDNVFSYTKKVHSQVNTSFPLLLTFT